MGWERTLTIERDAKNMYSTIYEIFPHQVWTSSKECLRHHKSNKTLLKGPYITTLYEMAVRSLSEVKQQLCRLVPGWVTTTVRVALLIDRSDTAMTIPLGNNALVASYNG